MSTKEELIKQAELVRDAKIVGENTAYRVGSLLLDIVNMLGTSGNTSIPDMSKYLPRSEFDEMFAWTTQGTQRFIDAKASFASRGSIASLYAGEPVDIPTYITSEALEARLKDLNVGAGGLDMEALESYLTNNSYATQDWVKRQGFLTGITGFLPLSGGTLGGALTIQCGADTKLSFNNTDGEKYSAIKFLEKGTEYSRMIGWEHKFEFSKYIEAPKFVAQTADLCSNLNADLLDGIHANSIFRESVLGAQNLNADNLITNWVAYTPNSDMNTWGNTTFENFPAGKPEGGFTLLSLREGSYRKQLYTYYNNNSIYVRSNFYNQGAKWGEWYKTVMADLNNDISGLRNLNTNGIFRSYLPTGDSYNFYFNNETLGITGGMGTSLRGDGIQGAYLWLTGEKNSWRFATKGTARMIIDPNGKVGFGTLTPQFDVDVNGDICTRSGRIYLTPSVWIEYDAANDVIRSNRTFVSKGDIGALTN
ncbi:MAG: hypothetical protein HDR74_06875 [Bacteroides sp.]|nr:hypothetical protein [Bacteroides sp.]